ncbi:MAG: cell surface protein SprA, partial [Bacteroidetes bacterium]
SSQALFGIKTQMQFGPLNMTAIVSQKKGSSKEVSISGGSKAADQDIAITRYSTAHYFVDTLYRPIFVQYHKSRPAVLSQAERDLEIYSIEVWKSTQTAQTVVGRKANAYFSLPRKESNRAYTDEEIASLDTSYSNGNFVKLTEGKDYDIHVQEGYISLASQPADQEIIAVAYSTVGGDYYGEFPTADTSTTRTLILKLVKPAILNENHPAWELMLKNIYPLGAREIKQDALKELKIVYKPIAEPETEEIKGHRLLKLLRLDRYKASGEEGSDEAFDFISDFTINTRRGELIFPDLRPFDSTLAQMFRANGVTDYDSLLIHDIYDRKLSGQDLNQLQNNLFVIRATVAGAVSARISLNSFNIVEGSVQVIYNGTPLTPGADYDVNYIIGEVTIRKEEALVPGANLQVKYEQNDLFQLAAKTLMGARGELDVGRDSRLGFTIMNLNQETLSDKVRIGEEPTNNTIVGVDGSSQWNIPFLTSALDALPGLSLREVSTLKLSGEAAYILPDPNTKRSTILGDQDASIAYIDDFEGARRIVPLSLNYTSWKPASPPVYTLLGNNVTDASKMFSKAKLSWYTNSQRYEAVSISDIWPEKSYRSGENFVQVLIMDYFPTRRGMYNYSTNLDSTVQQFPDRNWNGIQRYVASFAGDLTQQNLSYLEIWVNASSEDSVDLRNGRLFVDIGRISEDVIPNKNLNSEDIIKTSLNPGGIPNGIFNDGEDLGLDMLSNEQERSQYADLVALYPEELSADPSGDDFDFTTESTNFDRINGVEGNNIKNSIDSRTPDTEDLNNNGTADERNNIYIEYELPLSTTLPSGEPNAYIVGGGTNKWYQLRVALLDTTRVIGGESALDILKNVQYVRFWLSGFSKPVRVRIAEANFVGNQWLETVKDDTVMKVSVVNIEDNPEYTIPPGVIRERDRTQPDQEIYGNEQSLALLLNGLQPGDSRQAAKYFAQRSIDMFNYRALKLFVHGDESFGDDAEIFLRFGADTNNYYEYRQPLKADWDEMNIIFTELTSVKAARDSGASISEIPAPSGPPGSYYRIRGNPAITKVQYISVGVHNASGSYPPKARYTTPPRVFTGSVWVNEMRVVDVDDSPGGAYRFDTQVKLSDFGNIGFNYSYTGPNFHGVSTAFGDRVTRKSWAVNTGFSLEDFLPSDWQGASFPFAYSHQENIALPKYLPNTDVVVDEAARRAGERSSAATPEEQQLASDRIITESQTVSIRDNYTISNLKLGLPWQAWYVRDILNSLSFRFNYATANSRDPSTVAQRNWQWDFGVNYAITLKHDLFLQPFSSLFEGIPLLEDYKDWKLYLFPIVGFNTSLSGARSYNYVLSRSLNSVPRETRSFGATKTLNFDWKITEGGMLGIGGNYGISIKRDLLFLDTVGNRDFSQILRSLFIGGRDGQYNQSVTFNTRPKIPNVFNITKYLDQLSAGYRVNYGWQNTFQAGDLSKGAAWENSINTGMNFRLKTLADSWFADDDDAPAQKSKQQPPRAQRKEEPKQIADSLKTPASDSTAAEEDTSESINPLEKLKDVARILIKYPLLDYDNINISFTQSNRSAHNGVRGSTGFQNFWGRLPFQGHLIDNGPSRLYQLGLISDPSGKLIWAPQSTFPWVGWKTERGIRASNGQLTDNFSQKNDITLKTTRPLWEGASLDINWKVGWQYSKTTNITTDSLGIPTIKSERTTGSVERSFLTLPPVLLFGAFKSNLEDVGKKFEANSESAEFEGKPGAAAADAFERGMEALPFLNKFFGQFVPRPNWSLRWGGIEKLAGIESWMQTLSLDHAYRSSFRRDFQLEKDGSEKTDVERISYDFAPLIGLNMTFKELLKGNFTGSFQYKTSTAYDLSLSNQKITEDVTADISLSLSYSRRGFEFPLFGLTLKNDVDFTLTYSRAKKSRRQHDPLFLQANQEGTPLDGSIRTSLEPRIRYTLSARVNASLFYRYSRTEPDEGGSTIPGTTTNEAGVDIRISIQ